MQMALSVASKLASIHGPACPALESAEELLRSEGIDAQTLEPLTQVVALLEDADLGGASVTLDLGMARGIAYYTGIVFELLDGNSGLSLGGGGRYDGLARNMGSHRDVPALGFAYDLDRLLDRRKEGDAR
jgi:histidyl-tRNA synthetase